MYFVSASLIRNYDYDIIIIIKLHNMHMTITHINPKLWIRTYNGFAVIPDLRQTGISENLATFGQK